MRLSRRFRPQNASREESPSALLVKELTIATARRSRSFLHRAAQQDAGARSLLRINCESRRQVLRLRELVHDGAQVGDGLLVLGRGLLDRGDLGGRLGGQLQVEVLDGGVQRLRLRLELLLVALGGRDLQRRAQQAVRRSA